MWVYLEWLFARKSIHPPPPHHHHHHHHHHPHPHHHDQSYIYINLGKLNVRGFELKLSGILTFPLFHYIIILFHSHHHPFPSSSSSSSSPSPSKSSSRFFFFSFSWLSYSEKCITNVVVRIQSQRHQKTNLFSLTFGNFYGVKTTG